MKKIYIKLLSVIVITFSLIALKSVNAAPGFDSISFKPSVSQGPYFSIEGSRTLGQWGHALGLGGEFSNDSVVASTLNRVRVQDIIEEQVVTTLGGSLGLLDWLDVGALVTFVPYHEFDTPITNLSDDGAQMGDIQLNLKARILDVDTHSVGLAVVPYVTLPTGSEDHFVGNGQVTGGAKLVVESPLLWERLRVAANLGADIRKTVTFVDGNTLGSRFLYGVGANVSIIPELDLVGELSGWSPFGRFFDDNIRNLEFNGGARIYPWKHMQVTVGAGTGILDAIGAPDYRVFASVGYRYEAPEKVEPTPAPKEEVIRTNKVHFEFDKARILPESFQILNEIARQIKQHPRVKHVTIEGHTDNKGSDEYNQRLSESRAESVQAYLVQQGIPAHMLSFVGRGESRPIADNETAAGRALNRRVEFRLALSNQDNLRVIEQGNAPVFLENQN